MTTLLSRGLVSVVLTLAPSAVFGQAEEAPMPAAVSDTTARQTPFARLSASALSLRDSLVSLARAQLGRRYVLGGTSPDRGFDCSGLVKYLVEAFDVKLPRTAAQQAASGAAVPQDTSSLKPGDLLLFGSSKRISHVGIYVGDGRFIHASSAAGKVVESPLLRPPARRIKPWRGVRRVVTDTLHAEPGAPASAEPATAATGGAGPA